MDREEFDLLYRGYEEDRQRLIDDAKAEIDPEFDARLQRAIQGNAERVKLLRSSDYSVADLQRLEFRELEILNDKKGQIEAEREQAISDQIATPDQRLQEVVFGAGGLAAAEQRLADQEKIKIDQQEQANLTENEKKVDIADDFSTVSHQDHFSPDDFDYSSISEEYDSLGEDFAGQAEGTGREMPDSGIEPD
ncbi:MAG: hypothetical protein R2824_24070 [Saprospiraceae bacterium]|nr:hypothetical protein [Lewinella sp.]